MAQRLGRNRPTVGILALLMALNLNSQALAQPIPLPGAVNPIQPQGDPNLDLAGVALPRNNRLESQLQAAQEYIQTKNWQEATSILQKLLEMPEDVFGTRPGNPNDPVQTGPLISIRQEASRLLAGLPREGKKVYQLSYGGLAENLLKESRESGRAAPLGMILRNYLHTEAGAEAALLLGTYQLDRGNYLAASLCFEKLLEREGPAAVSPTALARAALAFHMAGDQTSRDRMFAELRQRGLREVRVATEAVSIDDWKNQLGTMVRAPEAGVHDWPLVGGNPKRNGSAPGGIAFLEPNWTKSTVRFDDSKGLLSPALSSVAERQFPLIPGMIPLSETVSVQGKSVPLVLYRSHWGIHAVNLKTGDLEWESPNEWSLDGMINPKRVDTTRRRQAVQEWMDGFLRMGNRSAIAVENSLTGTLSSDGVRVYGVNDLEVPPAPVSVAYGMGFDPSGVPGGLGRFGSEVAEAISSNRLRAYDLTNGKLRWETGGKKETLPGENGGVVDLSESHFLGAPLPVGGKLYALNEKQQEIRLISLDPDTGKPVGSQTLVTTRDRLTVDLARKTSAAHLAYGDGILVCPTNAGAVLGVDLLTGSLVWSFLYREQSPQESQANEMMPRRARIQMQMIQERQMLGSGNRTAWVNAPPMISGDRVVFTSPHARSLFCLNLRTGAKLWSQPRGEDDVYLACIHSGKVLVVGKRSARAIDLATGQTAWTVETGMPSGFGAASGNLYFLPLRESAKSKEPEICAIDLALGRVIAHTPSRKKIVPGNLVFHQGEVLSQGPLDIAAYSQLAVRLAQIDEKIRQNPKDPQGLADRGELRLGKGDLAGAISDLDEALKYQPNPQVNAKARIKLFEALSEAFQEDFDKWEPMLGRFEEMTSVVSSSASASETEKAAARDRRSIFLGLVARGREKQGRLMEALKDYDQLAETAAADSFLTPHDDSSLKITPESLLRGRLRAMRQSAKPESLTGLDSYLNARLDSLKKEAGQQEALKKFVQVFGPFFPGGRQAGTDWTRKSSEDASTVDLIQAERFLGAQPGRIPEDWAAPDAARALDALAVLYQNKNLLPDSASILSDLARRFPNETIRPGMTASRLYNDLAADRRFLPFLAEPRLINPTGPVKVVEERLSSQPQQAMPVSLTREGPSLPYFDRTQFHLINNPSQPNSVTLKATDLTSGETWDLPLSGPNWLMQTINPPPGTPRLGMSYQTSGHLMVLWVANWAYAVDPIRRKILWEKNLLNNKTPTMVGGVGQQRVIQGNVIVTAPMYGGGSSVQFDPAEGLLYLTREDGFRQRVGMVGSITDGVLPILSQDGLSGLDPVTGKVLWTRSDTKTDHKIIGADEGIILLVRTANDGLINGSRVVRAIDGAVLGVPDFSKDFRGKVAMKGSRLATFDDGQGQNLKPGEKAREPVLRILDLVKPSVILTKTLPTGSRALGTDEGDLAAVLLPDGKVEVFQLPEGKPMATLQVDPLLVDKVPMKLVADAGNIYLVSQKNEDNPNGAMGLQPNFMGQVGVRYLRANGEVYAFRRETGKLAWRNHVSNQLMIMEQFQNLPMIIFSSRFNRLEMGPNNRTVITQVAIKSYDKRTGKLIFDKESRGGSPLFNAFKVDLRGGRLDLTDNQNRISFLWGPGLAFAENLRSEPKTTARENGNPRTSSGAFAAPFVQLELRNGNPAPVNRFVVPPLRINP